MNVQGTEAAVFVARQPIFDRNQKVFAYELLFRSGMGNAYDGTNADASTLDVIANSFVEIGLDELTGGKRAFINFTRNLLLHEITDLLPKDLVTVEILEDVEPDEDVLSACRQLKDAGYVMALDDFVLADAGSPFLDLADIVKVDFMGTTPEQRKSLSADLVRRGIKPLAEKVETVEEFQEALDAGYEYFQGYFFSKPVIHSSKKLSANRLSQIRMLKEVNSPELSYEDLDGTISQDVALSYKLLRYMNSAWFGLRCPIDSIKRALVQMGPKEIRKWFALVTLRDMGSDKPDVLLLTGMTRAKMSETVGTMASMERNGSELFLMGMFSIIDGLLDTPMAEILEKLPLDEKISSALLGRECPFGTVYNAITSYEKGAWDTFAQHAAVLKIDENRVPEAFNASLKWAQQALSVM